MTQRKIALSIEEAADYTGIGQEHPEKTGGMEETSGIKGWEKSPDQNGYAGTFYGSQRGQRLEG